MKTKSCLTIILIIILLFLPRQSFARDEEARKLDTVTLYLENDLFGNNNLDRHYTNGAKISWLSQDLSNYRDSVFVPKWMSGLIDHLPFINAPERQYSVSLSLGQNIYTPEDKERSELIVNDRPYAGITYLGLGLHSKTQRQMDSIEIDVGIVGPHSYAEYCQKVVHEWIGSVDPKGWDNQLHDEPMLNIFFERKWKILQTRYAKGFGFDFIPHLGVSLGNVLTGMNLGGEVRFGWNLPNDFGTFLIRPGSDSNAPLDSDDPRLFGPFRRFGIHLFFAVDGRALARNIFLDGNTFRDSHSVSKRPFVADIVLGIGVIVERFKITYSHVYRTREFDLQREEQYFGAISISTTF